MAASRCHVIIFNLSGAFDVPTIPIDVTPFLSWFFKSDTNKFSFVIGPYMNSYWLIDANLKIWVDTEADPSIPFRGHVEEYNIVSKGPNYQITGNFSSSRVIETLARNRYSASGTIFGRNGWTKTTVNCDSSFSSELKYIGNHTHIKQAHSISKSIETKFGIGPDVLKIDHKRSDYNFPFKLFSDYLEQDGKFSVFAAISHAFRFEYQDGHEITIIENMQDAAGNFGSLLGLSNSLNQTLKVSAGSRCYQRNVQARNATVVTDLETDCRLVSMR